MKRLSFVAALLFFSAFSFAQVDTSNYFPPPPGNNPGVSSVLRSQKHLLFIDITENSWLHLPDGISTKFISGGFNFSIFYDFFIAKKYFGIAPGISFSNATVKNNGYIVSSGNSPNSIDTTWLVPLDSVPFGSALHFLKNKLSVSYLDFPVEFRFRIKPDERGKNFWVAPGFRVGFLISDFWKYREDFNGFSQKVKVYNIPNINKFHYGISLHTGYYKFGVYAYYSLSGFFEKNKGPDMTPFSVGITLTPL